MTIESAPRPRRLHGLDWIRGIAALWVWSYHLDITLQKGKYFGLPELSTLTSVGYRGVDLFFVLSGFVMARMYRRDDDRPARAAGRFVVRRVLRIYPAYVVVFLPMFLVAALTGLGAPVSEPVGGSLFVRDLLLLPRDDLTTYVPVSAWTLTHELMFYLLFGVAFLSHRLFTGLLALWAAICLGCAAGGVAPAGWAMVLSPLNAYFLCGYLCAYVPEMTGAQRRLAAGVALAALACGVLGEHRFAASAQGRVGVPAWVNAAYAAGFFLVVLAMAQAPAASGRQPGRTLDYLGRLSYGIYLVNYPLVVACATLARRLHAGSLALPAVACSSLAATLLVAHALNRWAEEPGIRLGQRLLR